MKLHILSDLHIEFEAFNLPATQADVVVLAGDIHVAQKGIVWAKENIQDKPVIYVLGNHEYYGKAFPKHIQDLKQLTVDSNIHVLENDSIDINGVRFFGCTLWTDFKLFGDPVIAGSLVTRKMTDYRKIRVSPSYRKLRSLDTAVIHAKSRRWLEEALLTNDVENVVVVTHHSPSRRSIPEHYGEDILSAAYASDLDALVSNSQAKVWIHGHIHTQQDYWIGETRVLCNPKGYPDEPNPDFKPDFVVETI
jgi:Icc-related predicted phosphoesterase